MIRAPAGRLTMSTDFLMQDKGEPDAMAPQAEQHALEDLPVEVLVYLLGSRYCETDRLSNMAWSLFEKVPKGWPLVQAICDYVQTASPSATPTPARPRQRLTLIRAARCVPGLRPSRGHAVPLHEHSGALLHRLSRRHRRAARRSPMDFSAWFEVYLGGRWYTFDARHNKPSIGRILMARGRDATDVAIVTSFGPCTLADFKVITDEVKSVAPANT